MASLYQRFTGKINTNNSFPNPPEASHLLGQGAEGERPAESQQRPRLQHQHSRHSEDEDVRINLFLWPFLRTRCALLRSDRLRIYRSSKPIRESIYLIYLMPFKSLLITTHTFQRRTCQTSASSPQLAGLSVNTWRAGDVSRRRGVSSVALCCCRRLINPSRRCWNTTSCCWRMILSGSALISTSFGFYSLSVCAHCQLKSPKCSRLNEVFSCLTPLTWFICGRGCWWISSGSPWRCYNPCLTAGDGAGPAAGWRRCPRCWNTGWLPGLTWWSLSVVFTHEPGTGGPEFSSFFKFATSIIRVFAVNEYICDYMVLDSKSCTQESYFYC